MQPKIKKPSIGSKAWLLALHLTCEQNTTREIIRREQLWTKSGEFVAVYLDHFTRSNTTQDALNQLSGGLMLAALNNKRFIPIMLVHSFVREEFLNQIREYDRLGIRWTKRDLFDAVWEKIKCDIPDHEVPMYLSYAVGELMLAGGNKNAIQ